LWLPALHPQVNKVQGEASDIWQKMANAEQGSAVHRLYKYVLSIVCCQGGMTVCATVASLLDARQAPELE
jgi:hypothetical protein